MAIFELGIDDLCDFGISVIRPRSQCDNRGELRISYEVDFRSDLYFNNKGVTKKISRSERFVFRGLHVQTSPHPQQKVTSVLRGSIVQVFADLDITSRNFGNVLLSRISDRDEVSLLVPSTFAHGFYALEETLFEYLCLGSYSEKNEVSVNPEFLGFSMLLSEKDARGMALELLLSKIRRSSLVIR